MKKLLIPIMLMTTTFMLTACDFAKKKVPEETTQSEWSCSNDQHIKDLETGLKTEYLKLIDRDLRESSYYQADQALLKIINQNLKFEVKSIRTVSEDEDKNSKLKCEGQVVFTLPKGLFKRAENAFRDMDCEECESDRNLELKDVLEENYHANIKQDELSGTFSYSLIKTDKEGVKLAAENNNDTMSALLYVVRNAVFYEAYVKENKSLKTESDKYDQQNQAQMQLAQKAMDLRKKELDLEKAKKVELLKQTWDGLDVERKAQLKLDQAQWFEKRDIDCKVLAQRDIEDKPMAQREVYQQHSGYWNDEMRNQNQSMQYDLCFIHKTNERYEYLNNLLN